MSQFSPNSEEARQLALILFSGVPALDAVHYFFPDAGSDELRACTSAWMKSPLLKKSLTSLQKRDWTEMTLEEAIEYALQKTYREMAYFLYAHNYSELVGHERDKADKARSVLEAKAAGMAGKTDALSRFFNDISSGLVKLPQPERSAPSAQGVATARPEGTALGDARPTSLRSAPYPEGTTLDDVITIVTMPSSES